MYVNNNMHCHMLLEENVLSKRLANTGVDSISPSLLLKKNHKIVKYNYSAFLGGLHQ